MEAETLVKTLAKDTFLAQERPETEDPVGKNSKEASGVGDKNGGSGKGRVVVNGGGGGGEEGFGIEDSEINGASTLLKMQRSGGDSDEGLSRLGSVLDSIDKNEMSVEERNDVGGSANGGSLVANEEHPDGETMELSGGENGDVGWGEFSVGDFVWGKIKSHPWWPGRIYDPSQASDYAMELRQRDKLLVAYFGDGTFAWCNSSQLKSFEEDFVEMSRQNGSKNFLYAVERSLDEVGRLVELKMMCFCIPKEDLIGFGRTLVENAGIKEGHRVPEGGIEKFSAGLFEPNHCLSVLKGISQVPDVVNMLELVVLRSWLSAFYRLKGGQKLPTYHDPQPIPGLEDDSSNRAVGFNYSKGKKEVSIEKPDEEDLIASPSGQQNTCGLLQRCQEVPEDRLYQRRKQKSIAEIIAGDDDVENVDKEDAVAEKEIKTIKDASQVERKKRKGKDEGVDIKGEDLGNVAEDEATLITLAMASSKKQRRVSNESSGEGKSIVGGESKAGTIEGTPTTSSGRKKRKSAEESKVNAENSLMAKRRSMKELKHSESDETSEFTIASLIHDGSGLKKSWKCSSTRGGKNTGSSGSVNVSALKQDVGANKPTGNGHLSREKKSKYSSPPFTTIRKGNRKEEVGAESEIVSSKAGLRERMTRAASNLIGSPLLQSSGKKHEPKPIKEPGAAHEKSFLGLEVREQHHTTLFDPMKVQAPVNEVLSQVKSKACNPQNKKESNLPRTVADFLDTFRRSIFSEGTEYNLVMKDQSDVESKSEKSESEPNVESHPPETRKSRDPKSESKGKQLAISPDDVDSTKQDPAVLLASFGPGSELPTKDDLIDKYGKYGSLNTDETNMFHQNSCAKIVFFKTSAAEAAFNNSQLASPFKKARTTFRLRYPANENKTRELGDISGAKDRTDILAKPPATLEPPACLVLQLNYLREKLEGIATILETPDGNLSPALKSKLQGEVKEALEKVSSMIRSSA